MAMTWTDIPDSDIAAGKPIKTGLMTALRDNDEANTDKPLYLANDDSASVGTTYVQVGSAYNVYVPLDAKVLRVRSKVWLDVAGTATVQARINKATAPAGTLYSDEPTSTATSEPSAPGDPGDVTMTLSGLDDVSGDDLRGQDCNLTFFAKVASGTATVTIRGTNWPASRFSIS